MRKIAVGFWAIVLGIIFLQGCVMSRAEREALSKNLVKNYLHTAASTAAEEEVRSQYNKSTTQQQSAYTGEYSGKLDNGYHYEGWIQNGYPEGMGTMYYPGGNIAKGFFRNGKIQNGELIIVNPSMKYVGEFENGNPDGKGVQYIHGENRRLEGVFVRGVFRKGNVYMNDKLSYSGGWGDSGAKGWGTFFENGWKRYEGSFSGGRYNGSGTLYSSSGKILKDGEFEKGKFTKGNTFHKNGMFEGEFRNGHAYSGMFKDSGGIVVTGNWGNVQSGVISYPDGRKYEGAWSGKCSLFMRKNACEKIGWFVERPHGLGRMTYPDGKVESGNWNKGEIISK